MDKHGYTVLHQAELFANQLDNLEEMIIAARFIADTLHCKLLANPNPDYGGMALPGLSDIQSLINRVSNTASCLQTLIMLQAIERKQV